MKKQWKKLMAILIAFAVFTGASCISPSAEAKAASKPGKTKITYLKSTSVGKATVKYKKIKGTKYQIQFATNSKMTKNKKTVKTSAVKKTVSLKQGKKYYVRVRAYKTSGGKKVYGKWSKSKTVTVKKSSGGGSNPGNSSGSVYTGNCDAASADYVLNTNTMKFHYPSCYSVSDIKPENKGYHQGSRDYLISKNYIACKNCNP